MVDLSFVLGCGGSHKLFFGTPGRFFYDFDYNSNSNRNNF